MTTTERWDRLDNLFARAIVLPPADRAKLLSTECADDPELAHELAQLLAHADSPLANSLDQPSHSARGSLLHTARGDREDRDDECCGPYRLIRRLGTGGMGTVYLARHETGDAEEVALKKLRNAYATPSLALRLRTERDLLASLDHPGIARFLDSGEDRHGGPYYVMEYVDGSTLTEHCDSRALDLRARVELIAKVADAMAHAHRRLVVHRDLKPANVLVTRDGQPKIVDFGIAKLLASDAAGSPPASGPSTRILTPDYCSPEQARGERITTASDVYSLGVILHELLCGALPHPAHETRSPRFATAGERLDLAFAEFADPERRRDIASQRSSTTGRLARELRGDLGNIVGKALAELPENRYPSADAFAEDLRRWLLNLPISARRAALGYRIVKFVRRNRLAAFALALAGSTAAIGGGAVLWQSSVAAKEALRAREATEVLIELLADAVPDSETIETARVMVERAQRLLESRTQLDSGTRADVQHALGRFQSMAGDYDAADRELNAAWSLAKSIEDERRSLAIQITLAGVLVRRGDFERVVPILEDLCTRAHDLGDPKAESESRIYLGDVLRLHGRARDAVRHVERAVALRRDQDTFRPRDLANALNAQCAAHFSLLELDRCESLSHEAIDILDRAGTKDSITRARSLHNLGTIAFWRGEPETADRYLRESVGLREAVFGTGHPDIAESQRSLFRVAMARGHFQAAADHARAEIKILERLTPGHWYIDDARSRLGEALLEGGDVSAAEGELRRSYERLAAALGADHEHVEEARVRVAKLRRTDAPASATQRR
ncbi:MAG: protein kinase [Planctomycetota bacterium]